MFEQMVREFYSAYQNGQQILTYDRETLKSYGGDLKAHYQSDCVVPERVNETLSAQQLSNILRDQTAYYLARDYCQKDPDFMSDYFSFYRGETSASYKDFLTRQNPALLHDHLQKVIHILRTTRDHERVLNAKTLLEAMPLESQESLVLSNYFSAFKHLALALSLLKAPDDRIENLGTHLSFHLQSAKTCITTLQTIGLTESVVDELCLYDIDLINGRQRFNWLLAGISAFEPRTGALNDEFSAALECWLAPLIAPSSSEPKKGLLATPEHRPKKEENKQSPDGVEQLPERVEEDDSEQFVYGRSLLNTFFEAGKTHGGVPLPPGNQFGTKYGNKGTF
jgi:hypothetical protein